MALANQFKTLQQAFFELSPRTAPDPSVDRQVAQQLISLLKPHVNIYKEMLDQPPSTSELPTTATFERQKAEIKTRANNIPPDELGRILSLEVERRCVLKAKQDLEHIKNSPSIDPVLSAHLTTQIKYLETKATELTENIETQKRDASIDANIATMNERVREAGLNTDIREQGSEQARLCIMSSPSHKRQLDAMTNTYDAIQPALEAAEALDSGATPERAEAESELSIALDEQLADNSDLAQALPKPSESESDAYRTIQQVRSLVPRFSVREHVKEVRDNNLKDEEIPSELFEFETRCNNLSALASQHDALYQAAHDELATTEARAKAKADIPAVQQKMTEEIKSLNIFMRRHAKGALKAVDPAVMRDITQGHALLVDKFTKDHGLLLRNNKQTKWKQVGRLLASTYKMILQPTHIRDNARALKEDTEDLLDNNNSRHLPRVSTKASSDSHSITHDPDYLTKNANSATYKTTVTFKSKTTEKNKQQRQQLSNLFNSADFKLRPNPPNSNDPKAQQFSTRQVLINTFGQKWADKNIKTKPNDDITILFEDNEASAIHQALSKANKEYTAWMKAQEPSKNLEASLTDTDTRPLSPSSIDSGHAEPGSSADDADTAAEEEEDASTRFSAR